MELRHLVASSFPSSLAEIYDLESKKCVHIITGRNRRHFETTLSRFRETCSLDAQDKTLFFSFFCIYVYVALLHRGEYGNAAEVTQREQRFNVSVEIAERRRTVLSLLLNVYFIITIAAAATILLLLLLLQRLLFRHRSRHLRARTSRHYRYRYTISVVTTNMAISLLHFFSAASSVDISVEHNCINWRI